MYSPPLCWDLATVEEFDEAAKYVRPEDLRANVLVSADLGRFEAHLHELAGFGFDTIYVHHVGREQGRFIDAFGERVLPALTAVTA